MRGKRLVAFIAAAAVAALTASGATTQCSFCRYSAWNCTTETAALLEAGSISSETSVETNGAAKSELRKETATAEPQALAVCNAQGQIQVDDVFCDSSDCACADGKSCVSLQIGCQNLFQARSRRRCISDGAIQQRFQQCAGKQVLTLQSKANLDADWVYFKQPKKCKSADCLAVRQFQKCGAVQCGYLVIAWKESATQYRFVVDGSRAKDMEAGTFLFHMDTTGSCSGITNTKIQDCYALQTRNEKNGTCNGIYLQVNTKMQAAGEAYNLSSLAWPEYLAVIGSVVAAVGSVASVAIMVMRHRRERGEDELSELLPEETQAECKSPELNASELHDASSPPIRQRVLSPRSLATKQDVFTNT